MIATTDAVFADTSFYVALASPADENHRSALALSFVVMQERGIREALTADRHFRQAGFRPLLETD
jgi:predicted nucleic acid-binding protein